MRAKEILGKVPEVTFWFWIIKIAATTLRETAGDLVTMSMQLVYLVGTAIFASVFVVAVGAQSAVRKFHPFLFWFVIVATTTAGTTLADLLDRSLGIGYFGGTSILFALLIATLAVWNRSLGSIALDAIRSGMSPAAVPTRSMARPGACGAKHRWCTDPGSSSRSVPLRRSMPKVRSGSAPTTARSTANCSSSC